MADKTRKRRGISIIDIDIKEFLILLFIGVPAVAFMLLTYPFKLIIGKAGSEKKICIFIAVIEVLTVSMFLLCRPVFWVLLGICVIVPFWTFISFRLELHGIGGNRWKKYQDEAYKKAEAEAEVKRQAESRARQGIFYGMDPEKAKSEYRIWMKKFHPDNTKTGDAMLARSFKEHYEEYCRVNGIKK